MLRPDYLEGLPDPLIELYAQAADDILADMARRISTYDYWIPAAEYQRQKLIEMGATHDYVMSRLSKLTGKSNHELVKLFKEAGHEALDADSTIYKAQGLKPPTLNTSKPLQMVLESGLTKTAGTFRNLTKTTARAGAAQFVGALDRAYMRITTGGMDYGASVRSAIKDLVNQGLTAISYPSGHRDTLETAVRRAVITGVNQTALQMQLALADEMECDLVETTAHGGARPTHAVWQGKVFSRSGKTRGYPDFVQATGFGSVTGLGGANCRHSFFPYFEGGPRAYSEDDLKKFDEKSYEYDGHAMTEYEATQQQRYIERQIRRWKRENVAMNAAGQDAYDSAAKVKEWQDRQADFLRQTGLKRQTDREQIANYVRKEAGAARHELAKYERYRYNKDGTIVVTDDWTGKDRPHLPASYRPHAVVDTVSRGGEQRDRMYYDAKGRQARQINNGPHANPKKHPFGEHGEHAHDIQWERGEIIGRAVRELSEAERKENADIL